MWLLMRLMIGMVDAIRLVRNISEKHLKRYIPSIPLKRWGIGNGTVSLGVGGVLNVIYQKIVNGLIIALIVVRKW